MLFALFEKEKLLDFFLFKNEQINIFCMNYNF